MNRRFRIFKEHGLMLQMPFKYGLSENSNHYECRTVFKNNGSWELVIMRGTSIHVVASNDNGDIIMQSTGQKDIRGIEIFEGDIVLYFIGGTEIEITGDEKISIKQKSKFEGYHFNKIVFSGGYYGVEAKGTLYPIWNSAVNVEVIGNIYQNPEMIEDFT